MTSSKDLVGLKFNRWLLVERVEKQLWRCICDCGTEKIRDLRSLKSGASKSCGCLRSETTSKRNEENNPCVVKHGMSGTPEWSAFKDARNRCNSPKNKRYKDYGGRGIKFLFNNFEQFLSDAGKRPSSLHSIDRINNNGNYEPGNIRWSLSAVQAANRRQTFKDLTGARFGRLVVLSVSERKGRRNTPITWLCLCDCGNTASVSGSNLKTSTKSCGCLRREVTSARRENAVR